MSPEERIAKTREALAQLKVLSVQLNEATDAAGKTVSRVERFLNEECSIGTWAYVDRAPDKDDERPDKRRVIIGYDRVEGQYRIVAQMKEPDEPRECRPWVNCDRETKLQTFIMLPGLLHTIAEEGTALCRHLEETNKVVDELTTAIENEQEA